MPDKIDLLMSVTKPPVAVGIYQGDLKVVFETNAPLFGSVMSLPRLKRRIPYSKSELEEASLHFRRSAEIFSSQLDQCSGMNALAKLVYLDTLRELERVRPIIDSALEKPEVFFLEA